MNVALLRQLFTFGAVGSLGYVVDLVALILLQPFLGLFGGRAGSYVCAATVTYLFNRRFTFGIRGAEGFWRQYGLFLSSQLAGAAANYVVSVGLMSRAHGLLATRPVALALGAVAGMGFNFALSHRLVFRAPKS